MRHARSTTMKGATFLSLSSRQGKWMLWQWLTHHISCIQVLSYIPFHKPLISHLVAGYQTWKDLYKKWGCIIEVVRQSEYLSLIATCVYISISIFIYVYLYIYICMKSISMFTQDCNNMFVVSLRFDRAGWGSTYNSWLRDKMSWQPWRPLFHCGISICATIFWAPHLTCHLVRLENLFRCEAKFKKSQLWTQISSSVSMI